MKLLNRIGFDRLTHRLPLRLGSRSKSKAPTVRRTPVIPPRSTVLKPLIDESMDRLERAVENGPGAYDHWRIVHLHVPKTAGSAFSNTFKKVFEDYTHLRWDAGAADWQRIAQTNPIPRFTTGHIRMSEIFFDQNVALRPVQVVCIVRHPLDRAVSVYNYGRSSQYPRNATFSAQFPTLQSFIERQTEQPNYQSRWIGKFAGHPRLVFSNVGRFHLGIATLEYVDQYAKALQLALSRKDPLPLSRVNELGTIVHGQRSSKDDLDKATIDRFVAANAVDYELYETVGEQWARRLNDLH